MKKNPKPSDLKAVQNALTNLMNSNTVLHNKKVGPAASIKIAVDVDNPDQIRDLAERLIRGGL